MIIEHTECGVCGDCIDVCPNELIEKIGYKIIVHDGCDKCGECLEVCPLGAIYLEDE